MGWGAESAMAREEGMSSLGLLPTVVDSADSAYANGSHLLPPLPPQHVPVVSCHSFCGGRGRGGGNGEVGEYMLRD